MLEARILEDPAVILELLVAPLHLRALVTRAPLEDAFFDQIVTTLLAGISSTTGRGETHPMHAR